MARRFPMLAVLFVLALALAACPDDVEEAVEDDQPTEPIEQVRDAASNTLGADSAEVSILLQADAEAAPTDEDAAPTDDDVTAPEDDATTEDDETATTEDDDDGLEDDEAATTEEDDGLADDDTATDDGTEDDLDPADPADDVTADRDEVELTGQEDFTADRRQLSATNGAAGQLELIVDGTDLYVLLNGDDIAADAPTDETTPTDEDGDNGLEDDDDATTDEDDDAATGDDPDTADEEWGWFDLTELHTDATEDGTDDEAATTATTDDDLDRFPFRDSHLVLQVLEDVEGDVTEAQDETDEGFDVYDVTVDVQETETTADGDEWLERLANGEERVTITVWIDDGYVVQIEYDHGTDTDATAPEDDAVTDDDDTTVTDDDDGLEDDDDAATDEEGATDDDGLEDDDTTTDDDDATVTDDDDATVTDDDDLTATTDEAAFTVTIEYRDLGEGVEIELPDDEQVVEIDEQELRQLLPALPGETDDAVDAAPTG